MTVVIGIDVGGTKTNATVLSEADGFLVDRMIEVPSRVNEGPQAAVAAIVEVVAAALHAAGADGQTVLAVGLDTPGPASAGGVISSRGATNFAQPEWWGFDVRAAVEDALRLPVIYNNDGNAAALYAHQQHFGDDSHHRSSVSAIVGTGLGGGVIEMGAVVHGASGMAGELGHVHIPMHHLLAPGQPIPQCNCGFEADLESVASLSGIQKNLLPFWLTQYPEHPLAALPIDVGAKEVRSYAQRGDEMALKIFEQQAMGIAAMFTIAANFTDPDAYFLGGGVVEAEPHFRDWFLDNVRRHTLLRTEQREVAEFLVVTHLDMAGARGSAMAALNAIRP
ncbi:MAG: ROK family protein [Actinomycetota bacterium]|nr:ROK family protein [Actinomycetota bacterium]